MIRSNVELRHLFRFTSTSGTATDITPNSLLGACGVIGTVTNTTARCIFQSVKVNKVTIVTPPAAQGGAATCAIQWLGIGNSPSRELSDTTVSVANPARVSSAPPTQSLAAFLQVSSTTTLFTLTAPTGSIIDVHVTAIMGDTTLGPNLTPATVVVGTQYYLTLDPSATARYLPVSLTTTA